MHMISLLAADGDRPTAISAWPQTRRDSMSDVVVGVAHAVDRHDGTGARRAVRDVPPGRTDELLDVLARRAADGSDLALDLLLESLESSGVVVRFVGSMLLDETAVDDVCQDVLISVATSITRFEGSSKVTTWVHRIVRNRVVDHLRRQRDTVPMSADAHGPARRMSTMISTRETVRDVLHSLPERYRTPVTLRDLDGLPYRDIARRLDLPVGTVKSQVARGRAMVAVALGEDVR